MDKKGRVKEGMGGPMHHEKTGQRTREENKQGGGHITFSMMAAAVLVITVYIFTFSLFRLIGVLVPCCSNKGRCSGLGSGTVAVRAAGSSRSASRTQFGISFSMLLRRGPSAIT